MKVKGFAGRIKEIIDSKFVRSVMKTQTWLLSMRNIDNTLALSTWWEEGYRGILKYIN